MMTGRTRKPPPGELTPPASASTPTATKMPDLKVKDESEYEKAWKEFYPTLNGSITASQFRQVMGELGEMVTDREVDELMGSVDGEEKINCKLFKKRKRVERRD
jgi:Ca2+-binding EF-hand superfamily protein